MTQKDANFIIETLRTAIEWAEYTDDYFKQKYGLEEDKENVLKSIEILQTLEEPKSCNSCKYFDDEFRECGKTLDVNVSAYIDFIGCGLHRPNPTS